MKLKDLTHTEVKVGMKVKSATTPNTGLITKVEYGRMGPKNPMVFIRFEGRTDDSSWWLSGFDHVVMV